MSAHKPGDPTTLNRLYGRSSGHKLRKSQQDLVDELLPAISVPAEGPVDSVTLFGEERLAADKAVIGQQVGAVGEVLAGAETDLQVQRTVVAEQQH